MKFMLILLILLSQLAIAQDKRVDTIVDYLRETPASVNGTITLDEDVDAYKGKVGWFNAGMKVHAKKGIGFSVSDQHLGISSESGLTVTAAGFTAKIKSIQYSESTGKFEVVTDTFWGIAEGKFKREIEKVLNEKYKPKMIEAFQKLKTIRQQKSLTDVNQIISAVAGIFKTDGPKVELPTIRGSVQLAFYPDKNKELKIDKWTAKIKKGDEISAGVDFVKTKDNISISGVDFSSYNGIRLHGETNYPEIASVLFQKMRMSESGVSLSYDIGAEEAIATVQLLIGLIGQYSGHPNNAIQCDPIRLKAIRESIDGTLKKEISNMIKKYRVQLLESGANKELLTALE
jgi:uncharacterized protein YdhG (YjbR/CyaY superfamily)